IETVFATLGIRDLALRSLAEMSGGQRQMVVLAQVLVRQPGLMLLDEPTSALDLHWQLNVLNAVHAATWQRGAIALVASHDLNLALRFCDQVLVLSPGGHACLGRPQDTLTPALLARTYGIEARIERCSRGHPIVLADRPLAP
ncbi:MAG: ABC transporter ATP-binding protein, partial [Marinobacter sp.]|nr:ABC transporter ATP-binding protein [Marinobacter sp.]